ncbi:single-stranded DNA-binding protein [Endozoicomonas sp. Mp262]|uniref:single-stranded DNA-binding protein n=1 Tax=Endozoicomonas sp. Mp262 TaxID=2919499 RepID=UPI0021DA42C0
MSINVITVSGHIGKDCETRYTQNGKAIASFSLPAVTGWGENKKTAWLACKLFGERAEKLAGYLTKGTPVTVTGAFGLDEWTAQDGTQKSRPVILVNDVALQGGRQGGQQGAPQQQQQSQGSQYQQRQPNQYQQARQQSQKQQGGGFDEFDSDIPF